MKCFAKVLVACAAAVVAASADSDATPAEATFDGKFSLLSTFEGAKTASEHGVSSNSAWVEFEASPHFAPVGAVDKIRECGFQGTIRQYCSRRNKEASHQ